MEKTNIIQRLFFPGFQFYLLLLLPVTFFGFFPTYISVPLGKFDAVVHLNALLMTLWLLIAIAQPMLIANKRFKLHRQLGKLSYVILPLVMVSGYLMISYTYRLVVGGWRMQALSAWPDEWTLMQKAAATSVIGFVYLSWLIVYFLLGILSRKKSLVHGMYMIAAVLTVLGPSGDRLVGFMCDRLGWTYNSFAEYFIFVFVAVFFVSLMVKQYFKGLNVRPALFILAIHFTGIFLYNQLPFSRTWALIAQRIF